MFQFTRIFNVSNRQTQVLVRGPPPPHTHTRIELYISSIKHLSILFTSNDNEANADVFACRKRSERPPAKTNKTKMAKNQRNIALIEITILGVRCAPYQMREMAPIASDFLDNYILRMANDGRNLSANSQRRYAYIYIQERIATIVMYSHGQQCNAQTPCPNPIQIRSSCEMRRHCGACCISAFGCTYKRNTRNCSA